MPRDGSGNWQQIINTWNPPINNTDALPEDWKAQFDDITAGLSQSVASDGQTPMTGPLKMGNNQITGLAQPTSGGHALRREQLERGPDLTASPMMTIPLEGSMFVIDGVTTDTINGFNPSFVGRQIIVYFRGPVLLHGVAGQFQLFGYDIRCQVGDVAMFYQESVAVWRLVWHRRQSGLFLSFATNEDNGAVIGSQLKQYLGGPDTGYGAQTYQDLTSSRTFGSDYTNSSGHPICVYVQATSTAVGGTLYGTTGAVFHNSAQATAVGQTLGVSWVVPPGRVYSVQPVSISKVKWMEYR